MVAVVSVFWQAFWLVGPPLGITSNEKKWYLAIGLFCLLISGGQAFYLLTKENRALKDVIHSAPQLVARGVTFGRTNIGADFYHLKIINDPKGALHRETAEKVAGTVQICDEKGTPLVPARLHRWAASPFIPGRPHQSDLQLPIDIDANGVEHSFDIAHKFDADSAFYTHNNESVAKYGYRDPNYGFEPGTYIVNVDIKGKNTAAAFKCKITNCGVNEKLQIELIS